MNKKIIRKLVTLGFTVFLTSFTLISSTYAFIILRKDASIEDITFGLKAVEGLQLSLDGENFSQDLSYEQITTKIEENCNIGNDGEKITFDAIKFNGVTPKLKENSNELDYDFTKNIPYFVKDRVIPDPDPNKKDDLAGIHDYEDASSNEYVYFDLYFRIAYSSGLDFTKKYNLKFSSDTKISSDDTNIKIVNEAKTYNKDLKTGDEINVKTSDAMRLAVVDNQRKLVVYEPNLGQGSTAIDGVVCTDRFKEDKTDEDLFNLYHDPQYNLMYTYYNSTNPTSRFKQGAINNESFNTLSEFTNNDLGKFEAKNNEYNTIKLTFVLWLEGWDADYIYGVDANDVTVKLKFEITDANSSITS